MRLKVLKAHTGLQERDGLLVQVSDPLIRAALTETQTHDPARTARLCDSDAPAQELLTPNKHA